MKYFMFSNLILFGKKIPYFQLVSYLIYFQLHVYSLLQFERHKVWLDYAAKTGLK